MLAARATADELMDADDLDAATYGEVVRDLARVNAVTLAHRPTLAFLRRVVALSRSQGRDPAPPTLKILDVGYGDGDMLRAIHRWGKARRVGLALVGVDQNPRSLAAARAATDEAMGIDFRIGDYEGLAAEGWDVVISSLVAHHMTGPQLRQFLAFMEGEARLGWFVNDLHRHGFAYLGYPLLAGVMRWHPIVRHDGRLSIARSYRRDEWMGLLADADIANARVFRAFPFRLCVERLR